MKDPKRVAMPLTKGIRIEAPGCIVYVDRTEHGGTLVDVVPDGSRFADSPTMVGRTRQLEDGKPLWGEESALGLRVEVYPEGRGPIVPAED